MLEVTVRHEHLTAQFPFGDLGYHRLRHGPIHLQQRSDPENSYETFLMLNFHQLHLWVIVLRNTPQEDLGTAFRITRTLLHLRLATSAQVQ